MLRDTRGGPNDRPKRYTERIETQVSKDAKATLEEMRKAKATPIGVLVRYSVMKDIYIYKNEKKRREALDKKLEDMPNE